MFAFIRFAGITGITVLLLNHQAVAQDWPQWRGPNRDAKAFGFQAPSTWPESLTQQWKVTIGDGVATPSLVGDKLFVFSRQGGNEYVRCLNADTGDEIWQDSYKSAGAIGPASPFSGPRSSPVVDDGRVVTFGTAGILSCYDADSGNLLWRNTDFENQVPRFSNSSSPLITKGLCIVQVGKERQGGIAAFELESGDKQWEWTGSGPAYGSPVLAPIGEKEVVFAPTSDNLVALNPANGELLWQGELAQGRYNAGTPLVDGDTVIVGGPNRGMTAMEFRWDGDKLVNEEIWRNRDAETNTAFNSPVIKDGLLFGRSERDVWFCVRMENGETAWPEVSQAEEAEPERTGRGGRGGRGGGRGRPGGGRGGTRPGYGSIVDVGTVLLGLATTGNLIVYEPSESGFSEIARYKVAESGTYAYPVASGNRIYVKDQDSVTMWVVQ